MRIFALLVHLVLIILNFKIWFKVPTPPAGSFFVFNVMCHVLKNVDHSGFVLFAVILKLHSKYDSEKSPHLVLL